MPLSFVKHTVMRLDLKAKGKGYILGVYMPQTTEQEKNLVSGEQNSQASEQCLKQCRKIIKNP